MSAPLTIAHHFRSLKDPRINRRRRHLLLDIVVIALCATLAGCKTYAQIVTFAHTRLDWFRRFLELPNGIPSHDTFERVFDRLEPRAFERCFRDWVAALAARLNLKIKHIVIDGKTLRGSGGKDTKPLHIVSAWAAEYHLSLGQLATAEKSNEITAIPQLLELLDLHGAIVTIDAMGCQKEIAKTIIDRGGHYALTVKDNQPTLLDDIARSMEKAIQEGEDKLDQYTTQERGHGRTETRHYVVLQDLEGISQKEEWERLSVVGMCVRERQEGDKKASLEVSYFIGSRKMSAKKYGAVLRNHWGIENNLHWQLDVSFDEDRNRVRKRNGAENLSVLRRQALMMLKKHPAKQTIVGKQMTAMMDAEFLEEVIHTYENLRSI
jgi:predicted transposase YbfD/YdcC